MTNVAVATMMRDSVEWHGRRIGQVDRFFRQIESALPGCSYFVVEGNSKDDTRAVLDAKRRELGGRLTVLTHEVEGSEVASIVSEARFANLSAVGNTALRAARDSGARLVLWVESDFVVDRDAVRKLLRSFLRPEWRDDLGVCPVPVFGNPPRFYDTFVFEGLNGERWGNDDLRKLLAYEGLRPMRAFGSCALLNGDNLRRFGLDFGTWCFPALCAAGREAGLKLWCDTSAIIRHPADAYIAGRLV